MRFRLFQTLTNIRQVLIQHLSAGLKYLLIQGLVKTLCRGKADPL
ncbi:hypothetical protein [Klebsiella pneumoniae IS46]|nr:hypothetical protein CSC13_2537 [Klebsiella pneumoniae]CDL18225.1 hypothetical protein [Klebsiella pneumoniae IS46]